MKQILNYLENPLMTLCLLFSAIPFWVPVSSFLLKGTDGFLMFLTALMSVCGGFYLSYKKSRPFSNTFFFLLLKSILFLCIFAFFSFYGAAGDKGDAFMAAFWITVLFYLLFFRSDRGLSIFNIFLWCFSVVLWIGFVTGVSSAYGFMAFVLNLLIFHRRQAAE